MKDKLATRKIAEMSHLANAYLKRFSKKKSKIKKKHKMS